MLKISCSYYHHSLSNYLVSKIISVYHKTWTCYLLLKIGIKTTKRSNFNSVSQTTLISLMLDFIIYLVILDTNPNDISYRYLVLISISFLSFTLCAFSRSIRISIITILISPYYTNLCVAYSQLGYWIKKSVLILHHIWKSWWQECNIWILINIINY